MARKIVDVDAAVVSTIVARIVAADAATVLAGTTWYATWGNKVAEKGNGYNLTREQSCALFATLSPRMRLDRNWSHFVAILEDGAGSTRAYLVTTAMRFKCANILEDTLNPAQWVSGIKVSAFYSNLLSGGTDAAVTIDRWAIRSVFPGHMGESITAWQNAVAQLTYTRVGAALGITGAQAQAVEWTISRGSAE